MNADGIMGLLFETMAAQGKQLLPEDDQKLLERVLQSGSGYEGGKGCKGWHRDGKRFRYARNGEGRGHSGGAGRPL